MKKTARWDDNQKILYLLLVVIEIGFDREKERGSMQVHIAVVHSDTTNLGTYESVSHLYAEVL